jgi:hypothetical protein
MCTSRLIEYIKFTDGESEYAIRYDSKEITHPYNRTCIRIHTISSDCGSMIGATCHLYDYLPCQRLSNAGNVLPAIVLRIEERKGNDESYLFRSNDSALDAICHILAAETTDGSTYSMPCKRKEKDYCRENIHSFSI